jgi:hypothetical protein
MEDREKTLGNHEATVMSEQQDVATRDEALALLTAKARSGSVSAAIALARELRFDEPGDDEGNGSNPVHGVIDRILAEKRAARDRED